MWACLAALFLSGLAVGGFKSLPLCGFIYDEYLSNYFVLNMSEINMSCGLIFSSNETFALLVCSRCEFRKSHLFIFMKFRERLRYGRIDMF